MASDERETAAERLDEAQREERRLTDRYDAGGAPEGELSAATELRGAREETAARGRWLEWVESEERSSSDASNAVEELRSR